MWNYFWSLTVHTLFQKRGKYCVRRRRAPRQLKHVKTVEKDWLSEMDSPVVEKERSPEIDSSSVVEKDRLREMDSSAEAGKDRVSQKVSASIDSLIKHNEQVRKKNKQTKNNIYLHFRSNPLMNL